MVLYFIFCSVQRTGFWQAFLTIGFSICSRLPFFHVLIFILVLVHFDTKAYSSASRLDTIVDSSFLKRKSHQNYTCTNEQCNQYIISLKYSSDT